MMQLLYYKFGRHENFFEKNLAVSKIVLTFASTKMSNKNV
jgi:hypothetical protein